MAGYVEAIQRQWNSKTLFQVATKNLLFREVGAVFPLNTKCSFNCLPGDFMAFCFYQKEFDQNDATKSIRRVWDISGHVDWNFYGRRKRQVFGYGTNLWDAELKVARNNSTVGCRSDDAERALQWMNDSVLIGKWYLLICWLFTIKLG